MTSILSLLIHNLVHITIYLILFYSFSKVSQLRSYTSFAKYVLSTLKFLLLLQMTSLLIFSNFLYIEHVSNNIDEISCLF